jgi:hypothetical protein
MTPDYVKYAVSSKLSQDFGASPTVRSIRAPTTSVATVGIIGDVCSPACED